MQTKIHTKNNIIAYTIFFFVCNGFKNNSFQNKLVKKEVEIWLLWVKEKLFLYRSSLNSNEW